MPERQAELPQIGIGQGWQHRRVDLLGAKDLDVFRQAYLSQPTGDVDGGLPKPDPRLPPAADLQASGTFRSTPSTESAAGALLVAPIRMVHWPQDCFVPAGQARRSSQ